DDRLRGELVLEHLRCVPALRDGGMIVHLPAMSGPVTGSSSGAAEAVEEALVGSDDAGDVGGLGRRIPFAALKRAAEEDAVGPGEHVTEAALHGVADFRLRLAEPELATPRFQLLIVEQVAAAKTGAVEDERLRHARDFSRRRKAPDLDLASGQLHVADHLAKIAAGFDVHRVVAPHAVERERMLGRAEHVVDRRGAGGHPLFSAVTLDETLAP